MSLRHLAALWHQVNDDTLAVRFDFSRCRFLAQNAVAFLGGLARLVNARNGRCSFDWNSLDGRVLTNVRQNGFVSAMAGQHGGWDGNSIPYREDQRADPAALMEFLQSRWLGRGWVHVSQGLCDAVVGKVYEIYANAL